MAQKIYKGQTALSLELDTKIDLTTATVMLMKYRKPDKSTGQWTASVVGQAIDGIIKYDIQSPSDLDITGEWERWAHITFSGGNVAPGDKVKFIVYNEGY